MVHATSPNAVHAAFPEAALPAGSNTAEPESPRIGAVGHTAASAETMALFATPGGLLGQPKGLLARACLLVFHDAGQHAPIHMHCWLHPPSSLMQFHSSIT